jgi:UrcA family protein
MKKHSRSLVATTLVAVAATCAIGSGASAAGITGRDVRVTYSGTDVGNVDGATLLLRRIEAASASVCAALDHGDLASRGRRLACERQLTADAVMRVNSPVLADVYRSARRDSSRVIALAR